MSDSPLTPEQLQQARNELSAMSAEALPVCCATVSNWSDGRRAPIFHLDARQRPDVLDMPRALRGEAGTTVVTIGWFFLPPAVDPDVLGVMTWSTVSPVTCAFTAEINVRRLRPVLQVVAKEGRFCIDTTWPCPGADRLGLDNSLIVPTSYIRGLLMALAWTQEALGE